MLGLFSAGAAFAQTAASNQSPTPSAVATGNADSKTAAAPIAGANSFTESEARSRLEAHGYTDVTELMKDDQSIWRGKAMKDGKPVTIALDFQGNIVAR
ncbi:MAG TPA: hypothetical protein VMU87_08545 [Stellaceae bacterium]|nr:hypothetical protein [Stellaceae bacterium]